MGKKEPTLIAIQSGEKPSKTSARQLVSSC